MGINHHLTLLHQRRHAHRVACVFDKHQERRGVRQEATVQRNTVGDSGHTELTHAVVNVVPGAVFVNRFRAGPQGQVRWSQIRRSAEEFRQQRTKGFNRILRRFTAGDFRRFGLQFFNKRLRLAGKICRQLPIHPTGKFICQLGERFRVCGKLLVPRSLLSLP